MEWTAEFEKQSAEKIPYAVDYTNRLPSGMVVLSGEVTATIYPDGTDASATVLESVPTVTTTRLTQLLKGGADGVDYRVTFKATLSSGGLFEDDILLMVRNR